MCALISIRQFDGLTVTDQRIGLAIRETAHINLYPFDGIWGLAYASLDQTDNKTLVDRFYEQNQIKQRVFCIKIHYKKESSPSEFILGGCDVEADSWIPVIRQSYWTVMLNKIVLTSPTNGSELLTLEPNADAIIDTGGNMGKIIDQKMENKICILYKNSKMVSNRYANRLFKCNYQ